MNYERTPNGFKLPGAEVVCVCADPKFGTVLWIEGSKERMEVRVTPSGLLRYTGIQSKRNVVFAKEIREAKESHD